MRSFEDLATRSITVLRPSGSSVVVMKSLGLLSSTYTSFSRLSGTHGLAPLPERTARAGPLASAARLVEAAGRALAIGLALAVAVAAAFAAGAALTVGLALA
nr:hypothetical protein [Tanacetum cinerariifolium]